jgi:CheY-like chemotaxis protein
VKPDEWRILMVEDEFDSIQLISKILRHHGVEAHIAHNGRECLKTLETFQPTLITMDLALLEMDGWETLAKLRENDATRAIPVVAMTAYHSVNVEEDAKAAGFNAYDPKPLNTSTLIDDLSKLLN